MGASAIGASTIGGSYELSLKPEAGLGGSARFSKHKVPRIALPFGKLRAGFRMRSVALARDDRREGARYSRTEVRGFHDRGFHKQSKGRVSPLSPGVAQVEEFPTFARDIRWSGVDGLIERANMGHPATGHLETQGPSTPQIIALR